MTTDRKLPAEVEAALADHAVQTACAATGIAPASRADAAYERLASAILDALDREREVKACECSPEEACAYLTRAVAAEALLTEARAWGEEQRRQASEHYERAETAEAARASLDLAVTEALKDRDAYERGEREAREALRGTLRVLDGIVQDELGWSPEHFKPDEAATLARARAVLGDDADDSETP